MLKPIIVCPTIYDIDYNKVYEGGKKIILCDLDNTIITYEQDTAPVIFTQLLSKLKQCGFKFYIISNNHYERVRKFCEGLEIDGFLHKANKPLKYKVKKFLTKENINISEVLAIGDQIVTDLYSFGGCGMDVAIVKSINRRSEKWYTKINRQRERHYFHRLLKVDAKLYRQMKNLYLD